MKTTRCCDYYNVLKTPAIRHIPMQEFAVGPFRGFHLATGDFSSSSFADRYSLHA